MKHIVKNIFVVLFLAGIILSSSWCEAIEIEGLVNRYKKATDIQRTEIKKTCKGQEILASGTVKNAGEYNFFDEQNDIKTSFYRVVTEVQKTPQGVPYQISLLYKNVSSVKRLNKGQEIKKYGRLWKLVDDGLWIAVWLYGEDGGGEIDIILAKE